MAPLAAAVDRAVTLAVASRHELGRSHLDDDQTMARVQVAASYFDRFPLDDYFEAPKAIHPLATRKARHGYTALSWMSNHELRSPEVANEYRARHQNATCQVRLYGGAAKRPVAILVHGYMGGAFALEQRVWPLGWLDTLGFDAALFTLPFHGARAAREDKVPRFPQADIIFNVEAFRQSVADLSDFTYWLLETGHPHVGLLGLSLGGYIAALTATLDPHLSFLVPIVPLACLADFSREQGRLPRGAAQAQLYMETLKRAYRLVSPLARPPRIAPDRVLVVAGKADRITPPSHARALARHFSAPLEAWNGGHLLQFGRARSLQRVGTLLRDAVTR